MENNYYLEQSDILLKKINSFLDENNIIEVNGKSFKKYFSNKYNINLKTMLLDELSLLYSNLNIKIETDKSVIIKLFEKEDFFNLSILIISNFRNNIFDIECVNIFKSEDFLEIFCLLVLKLFNLNLKKNNFYLFPGICFSLLNNFDRI